MKLTLLSGEYPPQPGGVGDYTRCLATALSARGHLVTVLTIRDGALVALSPLGDQAQPLIAAPAPLNWSHRCWPAVIAALDQLRPTWLHLQYQTGAYAMRPGVNLLPWRLRALPARPRVAVTFHDLLRPYLFPRAGPARAWVNQRLAADADVVVTTNRADAVVLHRYRTQVIPIGSNIAAAPPIGFTRAAWRASLGVAPDDLLVAYFGLLAPNKGADLLLTALARFERPWHLLIVGGAATMPQDVVYAAALRAKIADLNLTSRVIMTGHAPDREVSAHLLAADCVALPFRDGASFRRGSLLAAFTHGCPVITTPPTSAADAALLASVALLTPPDDPTALGTALNRLAADPRLRAALASSGQALAARFNWDYIATQHEALYAS